jgi:hypothetical protein
MFHLFSYTDAIADMHFMLQKEVVNRLVAGPNSKAYGRLSVMAQYYCQMIPVLEVPPSAFTPPPKVDSAVVRLVPHRTLPYPVKEVRVLSRITTEAFNQRRKTIRNSLGNLFSVEVLTELGIDPASVQRIFPWRSTVSWLTGCLTTRHQGELTMINSPRVCVQVQSVYIESQSSPEEERYVFAYTVTIRNLGRSRFSCLAATGLSPTATVVRLKFRVKGWSASSRIFPPAVNINIPAARSLKRRWAPCRDIMR